MILHSTADDLSIVIEKIRKLHSKSGPFDNVILLGDIESCIYDIDLSGLPPLVSFGPLSTSDKEGLQNVTILRGFGVHETPSGLQVGFIQFDDKELEQNRSFILDKFSNLKGPLDILISRQWSECIADRESTTLGHEVIDKVSTECQPQYHFSYDDPDHFFELEPFMWETSKIYTRFINVPSFNSGKKWAYAFNIYTGTDLDRYVKPPNLIENPYRSKKRSLEATATDELAQKKLKTILPSNCHFCFTNPNVEDHMFISISSTAYLTIAKGPLSVPRGEMNFSGHCLLVPIEHIPKVKLIDDDSQAAKLLEDLNSYERSIVKMNYRKFDMSTVVFEIHSDNSIHFHKQLIPVPKYLIMKFSQALDRQLSLNNEKYLNNGKLDFKLFKSNKDKEYIRIADDRKNNYLQFTVYPTNEAEPEVYLSLFEPNNRMDLQFGRRVLAFLLRLPKRVIWNSPICKQSKEQEEKEVLQFQKSYAEYDVAK